MNPTSSHPTVSTSMLAKIGFLTVRRHAEYGYFGGYLVLNQLARPLEFHCTLPVKPSRAQAVLYGPTMEDFVCGEQIAKALIGRAKIAADLVVTDAPAVLAVSLVSKIAIVQLDIVASKSGTRQQNDGGSRASESTSLDLPNMSSIPVSPLTVGGHHFYLPESDRHQQETVQKSLKELGPAFDFCEPFERIVEALAEANPNTKAA